MAEVATVSRGGGPRRTVRARLELGIDGHWVEEWWTGAEVVNGLALVRVPEDSLLPARLGHLQILHAPTGRLVWGSAFRQWAEMRAVLLAMAGCGVAWRSLRWPVPADVAADAAARVRAVLAPMEREDWPAHPVGERGREVAS